jgi:hypothetical protein
MVSLKYVLIFFYRDSGPSSFLQKKDCPYICYKHLVVQPIPFLWALIVHA